MSLKHWLAFIGFVALSEAAGIIGSVFTAASIGGWYSALIKPELAPPDWVFGPVWTALFALMGIATFLVWSSYAKATGDKKKQIKIALVVFGIQLFLNVTWSIIFFGSTSLTINGLNNIGLAFVEIVILWLVIAATIAAFAKISRPAAWLLAPYLAWVSFAAYLNFMLWTLNS